LLLKARDHTPQETVEIFEKVWKIIDDFCCRENEIRDSGQESPQSIESAIEYLASTVSTG
jgi:hypothetical protein